LQSKKSSVEKEKKTTATRQRKENAEKAARELGGS